MGLLDDVRQTLTDVTGSVVEKSRDFSLQTRLQLTIKKLQVDRTKRIQELGHRTYAWFASGTMTTTGPVPRDVTELCLQLEDLQRQLDDSQRQLEEARAQAQLSASGKADSIDAPSASVGGTVYTSYDVDSNADDPADGNSSPAALPGSTSTTRNTRPLGGSPGSGD